MIDLAKMDGAKNEFIIILTLSTLSLTLKKFFPCNNEFKTKSYSLSLII